MKNTASSLSHPDLPEGSLRPLHLHGVPEDAEGFGVTERYRAADLPMLCVMTMFFGIIPGFVGVLALMQFVPQIDGGFLHRVELYALVLVLAGPFLGMALWMLSKLVLRRSVVLANGELSRRLMIGRRVVREKVLDLSEFTRVKVAASSRRKLWSYRVLCQGDQTEEEIATLHSRRDVVVFAEWLGGRLALPVDLPPLLRDKAIRPTQDADNHIIQES